MRRLFVRKSFSKPTIFVKVRGLEAFQYAEAIPGPTTQDLQALAAELGVVLIASLFERMAAGLYYNTAVVIDADGRYLGKYRKQHIPQDPYFEEKFYFTPGDLGYPVWQTRFGTIGVLICWDQWYPEAARLMALAGAEIIFYPTAIGWLADEKAEQGSAQHSAWETVHKGAMQLRMVATLPPPIASVSRGPLNSGGSPLSPTPTAKSCSALRSPKRPSCMLIVICQR